MQNRTATIELDGHNFLTELPISLSEECRPNGTPFRWTASFRLVESLTQDEINNFRSFHRRGARLILDDGRSAPFTFQKPDYPANEWEIPLMVYTTTSQEPLT